MSEMALEGVRMAMARTGAGKPEEAEGVNGDLPMSWSGCGSLPAARAVLRSRLPPVNTHPKDHPAAHQAAAISRLHSLSSEGTRLVNPGGVALKRCAPSVARSQWLFILSFSFSIPAAITLCVCRHHGVGPYFRGRSGRARAPGARGHRSVRGTALVAGREGQEGPEDEA